MPFNINEFSGKISKYGLARDNMFIVRIMPPRTIDFGIAETDLTFFCNAVSLPALNVSTTEIQPHGYGVREKRPTNLPLDNLNTTFMVDAEFKVKEFFHLWLQNIINYDNSRGYGSEYANMLPFEVAYPASYYGTVEVAVYSYNTQDIQYIYRFDNAFPVALGDISTAWANNNSLMTMPVQFAYNIWQVQGKGISNKTNRYGSEVGSYNVSVGNYTEQTTALNANQPIQDIVNQYSTVNNVPQSKFNTNQPNY